MNKEKNKHILNTVKGIVAQLSKNINGCRIIQRILEKYHDDQGQIRFMLSEIFNSIDELITDEFGNYVVSHVLEMGCHEDKVYIINEILDEIVPLSLHKFGSNVVEKCLFYSPKAMKEKVLDKVINVPITNSPFTLVEMMNNKYANYVVQRTYDISNHEKRAILLHKIETVTAQGRINPKKAHAKHVLNHLE